MLPAFWKVSSNRIDPGGLASRLHGCFITLGTCIAMTLKCALGRPWRPGLSGRAKPTQFAMSLAYRNPYPSRPAALPTPLLLQPSKCLATVELAYNALHEEGSPGKLQLQKRSVSRLAHLVVTMAAPQLMRFACRLFLNRRVRTCSCAWHDSPIIFSRCKGLAC